MPRKKLQRFAEITALPNILQNKTDNIQEELLKFLKKYSASTIELGCGRGEHTIALAAQFPKQFFLGIDYQGERLWYGANEAKERKLENVLFLQIRAENLEEYFSKNSINEIIIPFPDPYPRTRHIKRRLTAPGFLEKYQRILKPAGIVHLKTDDENFFHYSQKSVKEFNGNILEDLASVPNEGNENPVLQVQSYYEQKHRRAGKSIYYLQFGF